MRDRSVIPFQSIGSFYRDLRELLTGFQMEQAGTGSSVLPRRGSEIQDVEVPIENV